MKPGNTDGERENMHCDTRCSDITLQGSLGGEVRVGTHFVSRLPANSRHRQSSPSGTSSHTHETKHRQKTEKRKEEEAGRKKACEMQRRQPHAQTDPCLPARVKEKQHGDPRAPLPSPRVHTGHSLEHQGASGCCS